MTGAVLGEYFAGLARAEPLSRTVMELGFNVRHHAVTLPDKVHPNSAGARLMAQAAYKVLTGKAP